MTAPNSIRIDNTEYVRKDSLSDPARFVGPIKIAVLDRGFVYVGHVESDGKFFVLTNAKNVRIWGTTKGLGELVNGPLSGTKLDPVGTVRVPNHALISLIDVEQSKWSGI